MNRIDSLLGLAARSRNLVSGEFATEKAVKSGTAKLVLVSEDASDNTKKMFENMCLYYRTPLFIYGEKENLGHAIGKEMRVSVAVTQEGFAKSIRKHLETAEQQDGGR